MTQFRTTIKEEVRARRARYMRLVDFVRKYDGWATGDVASAGTFTFEVLPGYPIVAQLRQSGHDVQEDGHGTRTIGQGTVPVHRYRFNLP